MVNKPGSKIKPRIKVTAAGERFEELLTTEAMGDLSPDFDTKIGAYSQGYAPSVNTIFDGEKFPGGFGPTQLLTADYWTLRERSGELFRNNLYARGLIRRLVTNEINTGLTPEASPDEQIIGVKADSLASWTELVENRFAIWGKNKKICDFKQMMTFGALERTARMEALISGDILVVIRQSRRSKLPSIELISGSRVQTPFSQKVKIGHTINWGVEHDSLGRVVAHWVTQGLADPIRIPAFGEKTGRKISWLVYGTDKRLDAIRGEPILSIVLQSLKEIDRYRDSTQRKAVINSILAMFIKKTDDKMGSLPLTGGTQRKDAAASTDDDQPRNYGISNQIPGIIMEELQQGEEPVGFNNAGIDEKFGTFEQSIIQAVAWANEMPPEILTLAFGSNYAAAQAAINEFRIYLNKIWSEFGEDFCNPIYVEWMISEVLIGKISAPGFLEAWRDPDQHDVFGAWISADWYGSIKPNADMVKQVKASGMLIDRGLSTHARESRITTGTKFSKNIKRLTRENQMIADAQRPIAEFKKEFTDAPKNELTKSAQSGGVGASMGDYIQESIADYFEETTE